MNPIQPHPEAMSEPPTDEPAPPPEIEEEVQSRRLFLQGMGKWSGAAIAAAVAGGCVGVGVVPVGGWINRSGGWINRRGSWVNRGGSWVNRSGSSNRGGSWVNRSGGGGWVNRRGGRGSWINRR